MPRAPRSSPVIIVPGVTATYLRDLYPLPPETVWAVLGKDYERAQLHPDDLRYEAREPAVLRPDKLYEIAYEELIEELRYNLADCADAPVPVFPFGYDWRQPLAAIEQHLADFIDEVIGRTRLMRHYHDAGFGEVPKVNLLGHSMGGLVIAGYLERFGAAKVDKVATLAAPFRGSFEAMVKMATGTASIGGPVPSSREREAARLTPSLYHLLPSFECGIEATGDLPTTTFDPALWQPSIIDTIVAYIDRHAIDRGRTKTDRQEQGERLFASLLEEARRHRARIEALDLAQRDFRTERWLCVVGVGAATRVRMRVARVRGKPYFRLSSDDRLDEWDEAEPDRRILTGDGTVPFKGAVPPFLPYESLVCVTPEDYGYWEIADIATSRIGGFHGILPNMNMLHRMLVRHFTGGGDPKRNTWGRPAPGVEAGDWKPPLALRRK